MFMWLRCVVASVAILVLGGCSALLTEDLQSFRSSFVEAQKAGDLLYDEIAIVIAAEDPDLDECGPDSTGTPTCFDPSQAASDTKRGEPSSVRARREALELVSEYTLALVEIAEGKPTADLQSNIGRIFALGKGIMGFFGVGGQLGQIFSDPLQAAFGNFVGRIAGLRNNARVRASLVAEASLIAEVIDFLIEDTGRMYDIYYEYRNLQALRGNGALRDEMAKAAKYHEALNAYVVILEQAKATHARLIEEARRPVTSLGDMRVIIEEAAALKNSASEFWNVIRSVRG